ncbi:hypothetical protein I79_004630 [Cricetulus griseus]|uniref:Uncharacterized protein n=1 Tax=Cricetulus griseus TaxID=10029 RepID=G3H324_CRIGR|nr:hypothetical protein I79_004630 [Cricetulus griseus]
MNQTPPQKWHHSFVCFVYSSTTERCCAGQDNSVDMPVSGKEPPQSVFYARNQ